MNKTQVLIIAFSIVIAVVALYLFSQGGPGVPPPPGGVGTKELSVWGTEPARSVTKAFEAYRTEKKTEIKYTERDVQSFGSDVITALASQKGPDLIITDSAWVFDNRDAITPAPALFTQPAGFKSQFVDIVSTQLIEITKENKQTVEKILGFPLWLDPLVLYWNKDILNAGTIALPPADWTDFLIISNQIKKVGAGGAVTRAGSALGRANNIPNYKNILSLLLIQLGADFETGLLGKNPGKNNPAESALRFYTDFGKLGTAAYTWNNSLETPRDLFSAGKLGMMVDFASFQSELIARSPHLSFGVALAPQVKGSEFPIHYANIMTAVVTARSAKKEAAWAFAQWLSEKEGANLLLKERTVAPARRDLLADPKVNSLAKTASLNARRPADMFPRESSLIVRDIIESVADGRLTISEAIKQASERFSRVKSEHE